MNDGALSPLPPRSLYEATSMWTATSKVISVDKHTNTHTHTRPLHNTATKSSAKHSVCTIRVELTAWHNFLSFKRLSCRQWLSGWASLAWRPVAPLNNDDSWGQYAQVVGSDVNKDLSHKDQDQDPGSVTSTRTFTSEV